MFEMEGNLWWYSGMRAITAAMVGETLRELKPRRLLDVGCGTGYSLLWLRDYFNLSEVYGVDLSPNAAEFWKERNLDTGALGSADKLPFGDSRFDLVTCFEVIYQLNDERASAAVAEMHRVLKPEGLLFLREPAYQWMRGAHDKAVGSKRRYTLTDLRRLLRARKFGVLRSTYANTLLFWAVAAHRLLSKLTGSTQSDVRPVAGWLNHALEATLKLEARMLRRIDFPFGVSAIILARKESQ